MLSIPHLLLIALIVFIVFGAGKLPKVMADLGKGIRALKENMNADDSAAAPPTEPRPAEIARIESPTIQPAQTQAERDTHV